MIGCKAVINYVEKFMSTIKYFITYHFLRNTDFRCNNGQPTWQPTLSVYASRTGIEAPISEGKIWKEYQIQIFGHAGKYGMLLGRDFIFMMRPVFPSCSFRNRKACNIGDIWFSTGMWAIHGIWIGKCLCNYENNTEIMEADDGYMLNSPVCTFMWFRSMDEYKE